MRFLLVLLVVGFAAVDARAEGSPAIPRREPVPVCRAGAQLLSRVELFFGAGHATRSSERRTWNHFLTEVVTPRFPDGLTVIEAAGQWRGRNGLERELSRIIIILYHPDATSDGKIEAIRAVYKTRFKQQSVLRTDTVNCVSF